LGVGSWEFLLSYPLRVQLDLPFLRTSPAPEPTVEFVRVRRARKYILRVRPDGTLRVTIPRGGSRREAESFVVQHRRWVEDERVRVASRHAPVEWYAGETVPMRGVATTITTEQKGRSRFVLFAGTRVRVALEAVNLRPAVETALRHIAARELVPRLRTLAAEHGLTVTRVAIRNQRSRWGSCSTSGVITLNFRLVQMPPWVSDYVLLHELMHMRQQNHSRRYWRLVEQVCPDFRAAEKWLRVDGKALF
jgi:predicted metal-dependent hydrolase